MDVLIVKLGAAGDVVRTTTLLRSLLGEVTWLSDSKNIVLLQDLPHEVRCFSWEERDSCRDRKYDLVINLEDTLEVATYLATLDHQRLWGAHLGPDKSVVYTKDSRCWFDLSIVSHYGRQRADELKLANRSTYQELIFLGLGLRFSGEAYLLPPTPQSELIGDVAIASQAGPVWPMKKWAYFDELRKGTRSGRTYRQSPANPALSSRTFGGRSRPSLFGLGRQFADAFRARERYSLRLDLHLHQSMGNP